MSEPLVAFTQQAFLASHEQLKLIAPGAKRAQEFHYAVSRSPSPLKKRVGAIQHEQDLKKTATQFRPAKRKGGETSREIRGNGRPAAHNFLPKDSRIPAKHSCKSNTHLQRTCTKCQHNILKKRIALTKQSTALPKQSTTQHKRRRDMTEAKCKRHNTFHDIKSHHITLHSTAPFRSGNPPPSSGS